MKTDVALDLLNVDPALDLLNHHKKQIDPYGLDLHHRYRLQLTSDRQLLHLHRQLPQTMTISILLPTILGNDKDIALQNSHPSQNNDRYTYWTHFIHSTHCTNNNKRLSSPIHTHKETVSNKTILYHDYKQATGSNFDKSWNLSSTVSFHSWSVVYVAMSRVRSYYGLQCALALPSENSLTITSYTNNVVFKSALIL